LVQLSPSNAEIVELSKQEMIDAKLYARKTTVVNLADKAATTNVATIAAAAVQNGTAPATTVEARDDRDKTECRVCVEFIYYVLRSPRKK